jgi:Icc-related predicted phosphoesterase
MVLRILGLADLHDRSETLEPLRNVEADLVAFCGDLHNASLPEQARPAAEALAKIGPPVLIVPGNMDHRDVVPDLWREVGLTMIHGTSFMYKGYGFLGLGGMVMHDPKRLGNPGRYYHREEDVYDLLSRAFLEVLDAESAVVITHQPPRGARDTIYTGEMTGSVGLRRFVEERQPQLLLCGHIHEDRGEALIGRTRIINVGELRRGHAALIELSDDVMVNWIDLD